MKKLNILILLFFVVASSFSQSINDYRINESIPILQTRNWSQNDTWQRFNGTTWEVASNYPGRAGTAVNDVIIDNQINVTLNDSNLTGTINSITIGNNDGNVDTLTIQGDSSLNTSMFTIASDGFFSWNGNRTLTLPAGTNFVIEPTDPSSGLELGVTHGLDETPPGNGNTCTSSKRIDIGNVTYSNCSGSGGAGGNAISFETVNDSGGLLNTNPTASASPTCRNKSIQLTANVSGSESNDTPLTYTWTVTQPNDDTYSLTNIENPSDTPSAFGTYVYEVTVDNNSGLTNTDTIEVEVESCRTIVTNRYVTYRVNGVSTPTLTPTPTLPLLPTNSYSIDRYRDNGSNDERLDFKIQNGFNFTQLQILISDVPYSSITIQTSDITQPDIDLLTTTSVISGNSVSGTGYDHLISISGTTFQGNRDIKITFDTPNPHGNIDCGGNCPKVTFYGN